MKTKQPHKKSKLAADGRDRKKGALTEEQKAALRKRRQQIKKQAAVEAHAASKKYIKKLKEKLLQPSRKLYGGLGYAKESVFLELDDPKYAEKFEQIWNEHIPGFSGKSFKKRKAAGDTMLWRQRLEAKSCGQATLNADEYISKLTSTSKKSRGNSTEVSNKSERRGKLGHVSGSMPQMPPATHNPQPKKKRQQEQTTVVGDAAALQAQAIAAYRKLKAANKVRAGGS